jgi:hypothetical protein
MKKQKRYEFTAQITDDITGEVVVKITTYSRESLEEEMAKQKWTNAINVYEDWLKEEERNYKKDDEEESTMVGAGGLEDR